MKKVKQNIFEQDLDKRLIDPLVKAAAEERTNRDFESDAQYSARLKEQIHTSMQDFGRRVQTGIFLLKESHIWPDNGDTRMRHALKKLAAQVNTPDETAPVKTLQQLAELTNEELTSFYTVGLDMYNRKAFEQASCIFLFLTQLNPKIPAFWSALGAAEELQEHLQEAAYAYIMGTELEVGSLNSCLRGANCLIRINKTIEAKNLLDHALQQIEKDPSLQKHKQEVELLLKKC